VFSLYVTVIADLAASLHGYRACDPVCRPAAPCTVFQRSLLWWTNVVYCCTSRQEPCQPPCLRVAK